MVGQIHVGGQRYVYEISVAGERRVLKVMPESARARAEREVTIGRNFDHPNLSRIMDEELQEVEIDGETFVPGRQDDQRHTASVGEY